MFVRQLRLAQAHSALPFASRPEATFRGDQITTQRPCCSCFGRQSNPSYQVATNRVSRAVDKTIDIFVHIPLLSWVDLSFARVVGNDPWYQHESPAYSPRGPPKTSETNRKVALRHLSYIAYLYGYFENLACVVLIELDLGRNMWSRYKTIEFYPLFFFRD